MMGKVRTIVDCLFQGAMRGYVISTCIHEYAHLVAIRLLGGSAVIKSGDLNHANWVYMIGDPSLLPWVYLAGGLSTGSIYLALSVGDSDPETKPIMVAVGVSQIIYGLVECLWYVTGEQLLLPLGGVVLGAGAAAGIAYSILGELNKSQS